MIHNFMSELSGPLVGLLELGSCSFPMTLIVEHSNIKAHSKGSPVSYTGCLKQQEFTFHCYRGWEVQDEDKSIVMVNSW